jgi:hypothetical protein
VQRKKLHGDHGGSRNLRQAKEFCLLVEGH